MTRQMRENVLTTTLTSGFSYSWLNFIDVLDVDTILIFLYCLHSIPFILFSLQEMIVFFVSLQHFLLNIYPYIVNTFLRSVHNILLLFVLFFLWILHLYIHYNEVVLLQ